MSVIDPRKHLLSEGESQRIFRDRIVPQQLAQGVSQQRPVVVFVAGQPGAGKTKTTESVKAMLDRRGGAIVVNSDYYKPYQPDYGRLLVEDDRNAAPYTSMDGRRWMADAERYLIARRVDTIIETTMRDPGDFVEPARMFRDAGYRVEVAILAVPEAQSRLGIIHRYHDQVRKLGHGRLTARDNHDASYRGVIAAAVIIDRDRIVDVASVYRRGNILLATNQLDEAGQWRWPDVSIAATIGIERQRSWSTEETQLFADVVTDLSRNMGAEWSSELRDLTALAVPLADQPINLPILNAAAIPNTRTVSVAFPSATKDMLAAPADPQLPVQSEGSRRPSHSRGEEPTR